MFAMKLDVVKVLMNNNYPMRFIKSCDSHRKANRRVSDSSDTPNDAATSFVVLPYVKGVTERISKVLRNNGVKVGFKPLNTLRTRFPRPKDKLTAFQSRCVVYRVNCLDCNFTYYGQTDRALATRIKEHQRAVRVCDKNSKIAQHANTFGHDMDFNHAAVVDKAGDYHKRLFLEAWHSQRDQNAGNEHIDIPDVYNSPEISSEDTGHLCQSVLQDFSSVLSVDPASSGTNKPSLENGLASQENGGGLEHDVTDDVEGVISSSLMVKLVVMAIATVTRLQSKGSQESSVATAFTLAFLSLLLQNCISSFENFLAKEHSNPEHPVANGPTNAALLHNGLSKHENSVQGSKAQSNFNEAKKLKKVMKHRRRRRRRRNIDYSFESYSGSGSDLDESADEEEDEDSDLSEGGGEIDEMLDDLMSEEEDSEDVCIESESDNESGNTGSLPKTVFSSANGKHHENGAFPRSTEKLPSHQTVQDKLGFKAGFLGQNGVSVGKMFRPDLFSDVSDAETESSIASRAEILRDCVESKLLKAIAGQKLLPAIKVLTDWLRLNGQLVMTCVESLSALWSRMATLLNKFPSSEQIMAAVPLPRLATWRSILDETLDENWVQTRGLPEDVSLLGFTPLATIHSRLDRNWSRLTRDCQYLEAAVRVQCLRSFGMKLASTQELSSFAWDQNTKQFLGPQQMAEREKLMAADKRHTPSPVGNQDRRSRVMKVMAQQLLQSEVAELESTLKTAPRGGTVYLVPDAMALCTQLHLVRRLIVSEKLVIIIPIQVISALDELKKYDSGAREATKFLEQEFKKGNRWIRAQKDSETMDGGRRRGRYEDVAVWRFNQIINCCRFFVSQTGQGLVTLLTGAASYESPKRGQRKGVTCSGTRATPEAVELARSCGVNVESLRAFCARFCNQTKSVT
ncbi:hypothetical protein ACROYT_G000055 [Oculina patagonica]